MGQVTVRITLTNARELVMFLARRQRRTPALNVRRNFYE
jgi:hypothetical protein